MHILSVLLFAIAANLDCLAIGLSYGIKNIKINSRNNLLIATITTLGTFFAMLLGTILKHYLTLTFINQIGSLLLIILGLFSLAPQKTTDSAIFQEITPSQTVLLSLALAMNNMALGVGASLTGLPYLTTCWISFIVSFLFIQIPQLMAQKYLSKHLEKYAPLLSGIIILCVGLYEFFI